MTVRATINPELFHWAITRSGQDEHALFHRFKKLPDWIAGDRSPTLKQLQAFAKATHTPVGYLFLERPPAEEVPIPDFRTVANSQVARPSADLLDTIYLCQQRQDWYLDYARSNGFDRLDFIGSVDISTPVNAVAATIRSTLNFDLSARATFSTWAEARRQFIGNAEEAGILVMCNGVVFNNTRRKLKPEEFRGFALVDDFAPLVFINGADSKSAQMFTLAHELAHLWLGQSALSSADISGREKQSIERWCNQVAAELLVPMAQFKNALRDEPLDDALRRLAKQYKVSTLVILRRMRDCQYLSQPEYHRAYEEELERLLPLSSDSSGGNFYASQPYKLSKRFAQALVASTLEGHTLYRDAMRLMGVKKTSTFDEIGRSLGVAG